MGSPAPATWLAAGIAAGAVFILYRRAQNAATIVAELPDRLFKLATSDELAAFEAAGKIESALDMKDGFVHLSDRTSPPNVARLFFAGAKDLHLIELKASALVGRVQWFLGPVRVAPKASTLSSGAATTVHYDHSCGCVHVYGAPVGVAGVVRSELLQLDAEGMHRMPAWL